MKHQINIISDVSFLHKGCMKHHVTCHLFLTKMNGGILKSFSDVSEEHLTVWSGTLRVVTYNSSDSIRSVPDET